MKLDFNEEIIIYVRKHWILFAVKIIPLVLLALLPALFPALLSFALPKNLERFQDASWVVYFLWLIVLWVWGFVVWTEYYLDVWVVTERKVINADQVSLFSRRTSTLELEKIQDITIEVNGFIETMFSYGTMRVQTAGELESFILEDAFHPEEAKRIILEAQERVREDNMKKQSTYIREHFDRVV